MQSTTEERPFDLPAEDGADDPADWMVAPPRTLKVRPLTLTTVLLLILSLGIFGGVSLEKHHKAAATTSRSATAGSTSGTSGTGFPGGSNSAGAGTSGSSSTSTQTSGTISALSGDHFTVVTSAKKTVKVVVSSATVVSRTGKGSSGSLSVGDQVTAVGKTTNGSLDATSVVATEPGVSSSVGFGSGPGSSGGPPSGGGA